MVGDWESGANTNIQLNLMFRAGRKIFRSTLAMQYLKAVKNGNTGSFSHNNSVFYE